MLLVGSCQKSGRLCGLMGLTGIISHSRMPMYMLLWKTCWNHETDFPKGFRNWEFNSFITSCEELTHWKRLWCWEGLGAGGEGDDRGWDGWMASLTRWTWVWLNSGRWWWTGRPGVLWFMELQRVGHDWATELNWIELKKGNPQNSSLDVGTLLNKNTPIIWRFFSLGCLGSLSWIKDDFFKISNFFLWF